MVNGKDIKSTKNQFKKGHILYGKLRPYLNKVLLTEFDGICSTDILVLQTEYPLILKYALLDEEFVKKATAKMKGTNHPRISPKEFLNLEVPFDATQSESITKEILSFEKEIKQLEKEVEDLEKKKKEILNKYLK